MLNTEAGPVAWMKSTVLPWIENPERDIAQLSRWLSGNDLPPVGEDEEPYVWLLRALPRGAARPHFESELARSAAKLLERTSELRRLPGVERLLYNLLGLCAGLRGRDYLSVSLEKLLRDDSLHALDYEGATLNSMLLSALICNQRDATLKPIWEAMVQGVSHSTLEGNPFDGFLGILYMPPSQEERGSPALEAIGFGLNHLLRFLDARPNKVTLLRSSIDRVQSRYPGHPWALTIIEFSDQYRWPRWTDVALPDLSIRSGQDLFITWLHVRDVLSEQFDVAIMRSWAEGRICEIHVPSEGSQVYETVARTAEKYRSRSSFGGEKAEQGIVSSFCEELNILFKNQRFFAAQEAAQRVLGQNQKRVYAAATS